MLTLGEKVRKIRSKNAGPFWITIDVFCGDKKIYMEVYFKNQTIKVSFVSDFLNDNIKENLNNKFKDFNFKILNNSSMLHP